MPSSNAFPEALAERIRTVLRDVPTFPDWEQYTAGRNGELDPLTWLAHADSKAHAEAFHYLYSVHGAPFAPIDQSPCESAAVMHYLQALAASGVNPKDALGLFGPVPFCMVGHLVIFAHCDPAGCIPPEFPRALCSPLWVSVDDYLRLREDFLDRARDLLVGIGPVTYSAPAFVASSDLRAPLRWVSQLPTIGAQERSTIDFLVSLPDSELRAGRVSASLKCSLEAAASEKPVVLPAQAIRISPSAMGRVSNRQRLTDLGFAPYLLTRSHVLAVADDPGSSALAGELSNAFPGLTALIIRGASDGIRSILDASARGSVKAEFSVRAQEEDLRDVSIRINPQDFAGKTPRAYGADIGKMLQYFLCEATSSRASDIHIDIYCKMMRVRYVIDGDGAVAHSLPRDYASNLANHLRDQYCKGTSVSSMPAAPQEGAFTFGYMGKRVMCRIGITYGNCRSNDPKIVLRILDRSNGVKDLALLNLYRDEIDIIRRNLRKPKGLILVSGSTGSGKSTTLMACLQDINDPKRFIYTLEDPIEYEMAGVQQIAVASKDSERTKERISAADGVRMLLRMDPDVVMVGEIRDKETADAAIDASNTGHLIFSTVHANSAIDVVKRLTGMGVDRVNLGENICLLTAQVLVKRLCACYKRVPIDDKTCELFDGAHVEHGGWVGHPVGCPRCRGTGYYGRLAVMELLEVNEEFADLVTEGARAADLRECAVRLGYISMRKAVLRRVASEQTSIEAARAVIARI